MSEPALSVLLPDAGATRDLARRLAGLLRAGDLLVLTGGLGAGKTTFTQGLGEGLGVRGPITSPTFVVSRVHPSLVGGPDLVHVDAYRLGGADELDALDLDTDLGQSVTVVEWGAGLAEALAQDHLELVLERDVDLLGVDPAGTSDPQAGGDEPRRLTITGHGERWADAREALRPLA